MKLRTALFALVAMVAACSAPSSDDANMASDTDELVSTPMREVTGFGKNPGALRMFEHVPKNLQPNAPIVVVLHGCLTQATNIADVGWNDLSDQKGFVVVYPQQSYWNNGTYCFNWADPMGFGNDDAERGGGESESIREMTQWAMQKHGSDPNRVYAAGFSAGAAMAVDLAAAYPDLYAGVASFAGVPYGCATTLPESVKCMIPGVERTAKEHARRVKATFPSYTGRRPKMSIWQGSLDNVVWPGNQDELVKQWTTVHGVATSNATAATVDGQAHREWRDTNGDVVVETYTIEGMWHAVPVTPGNGCGKTASFSEDHGICGVRKVADFFGL